MTSFKVWDRDNDDEYGASTVEARSPSEAAEQYCDDDCDGQTDGYYMDNTDNGAPVICVRDESGKLSRFKIFCDYNPTFTCREIADGEP